MTDNTMIIPDDTAASTGIDIGKKAPIGMPASSWILLEENEDIPPTGLFLGHNGTGFLICTGVPVLVPDYVIALLDLAVQSSPVVEGNTQRVIGHRERRRYSYRRVAAPADAE